MTAFSAGVAAMFRDPNLSRPATVWSAASPAELVSTRAIRARPDENVAFGSSRAVARVQRIDLPVAGLPELREGDQIEIEGCMYVIIDAPRRDREHLVWQVSVRQAI